MTESGRSLESALIVDEQVDVVSALRRVLERRSFEGARIEAVTRADGPGRARHFLEAVSFVTIDPKRLRDLVITFLASGHSANHELVLWIRGGAEGLQVRYAVIDELDGQSSHVGSDFQRMLESVFPGITLQSRPVEPGEALARDLAALRGRDAAGVLLGIPSERKDTEVETRLDDVLNGLAGRDFDVLVHARPASLRDVDVVEDNLAHLASVAHQLTRQQLSVSESESFSASVAEGVSASWSTSETKSWSSSESVASSKQIKGHGARAAGVAAGALIGGILGAVVGAPSGPGAAVTAVAGAKVGAIIGVTAGGAIAGAIMPPVQESRSSGSTDGGSSTTQSGGGSSATTTTGLAQQWGSSVGIERLNRQAGLIGELAELHLARARGMKSFGAWHVSVHVAAPTENELHLLASLLIGALRGDQSHLEPLRFLPAAPHAVPALLERAAAFRPETYYLPPHPLLPRGEQPSTLLSSEELAHWFRPPSSPIVGIDVRPHVSFGAAVPAQAAASSTLRLGPLIVGGRTIARALVELPTTDLLRHCFIAGTTGSGKTTTVRRILLQLAEQGVPFLVVEPAKTEYGKLFEELARRGKRPLRLSLRGGDGADDRALRFNPWRVPSGAVLGRHVEGMKLLLRSCFSMQESLPQILERAVFEKYAEFGWHDLGALVPEQPTARFPTFADFVTPPIKAGGRGFLAEIVGSLGYDTAHAGRNLTAAITVRFESFTRGLKGSLFADEEGQFDEIFTRPTFIELADLNEPDIKRFLLGALVQRLATELEVRNRRRPRVGLQHVLVLEEAHHFLRETVGHGPGSELARESNTLLADAFAEMRAYGEGIIVADQAPAELSPAVLRNTNLKIAHRLLYEQDCVAMGNSMGLDESQQHQLRALRPGECVVHGADFGRAVQCRVERGDA